MTNVMMYIRCGTYYNKFKIETKPHGGTKMTNTSSRYYYMSIDGKDGNEALTLKEAVKTLAIQRLTNPQVQSNIFDADGYIVPSSEIAKYIPEIFA